MLTVIICTYNRSKMLENCLRCLSLQNKQAVESCNFMVVDNSSSDNTKQIVESFNQLLKVDYIFENKIGLSFARNKGIKEAKTAYVCFLDDDAIPGDRWLMNALKIIYTFSPKIFGGPILPFYTSNKPSWFFDNYEIRSFGDGRKFLGATENLSGSNIFFKKELFKIIGLFNTSLGMSGEKIGLGEESLLQQKAKSFGIYPLYCPDIVVRHYVPDYKMSLSYILKRKFVYGTVYRNVYKEIRYLSFFRDIYCLIKELLRSLILFMLYPFRDRAKHLYWQNYLVYTVSPFIVCIGKIYSYKNRIMI